jgi:hypothetical protein
METIEVKKEEPKKFGLGSKLFAGLLILLAMGVVFAGVVTYLSNTAELHVQVDSPMSIDFAKVIDIHYCDSYRALGQECSFHYTGPSGTDITLEEMTGLETIELAVKVQNHSQTVITNRVLLVTVSNSLGNVDVGDITSLQFYDIGASVGSPNRTWQELVGAVPIVDTGPTVTYAIPINSLAAAQTKDSPAIYEYPVTATFGIVEPANYTITAVIN